MENLILLSFIVLIKIFTYYSPGATALSSCNGPCTTWDDCSGQLICINGRCNDDPDVGTHICTQSPPPPPPPGATALSSCNGPCTTWDDCSGQLICVNGRCNDDPDVGTHICTQSPPPPPSSSGGCQPSGTFTCNGQTKSTYTCSPPVASSTSAILTLNDFSAGGDGGGPSECDNSYHSNTERVVALSTGWYAGGSRCGMFIRITASNGRSTTAKVVDECDSRNGCDAEHAYQPPCDNNIVDGSDAVWGALGLNENLGRAPVTWAMV